MANEILTPELSNSNIGDIKTEPSLTVSAASKSLDISEKLGIQTDPVGSFQPSSLEVDIAPEATSVRSVANESNKHASLIKPDAESLSTLEKYSENVQIQFKTASLQDNTTDLILKQIELRGKGQELSEDDLIKLDATELEINDLEVRRNTFDLNLVEKAVTGDLPSVFRDMGVAAAESPVLATIGALGFLAGPVVGGATLTASTSAASAVYNYNRTLAKTYRDLEDFKDNKGNALPHDLKLGISRMSSGAQTVLETASDVVMKKMSKLWNGPKIASKIAEKAMQNPTFRNKLTDLATRAGTASITEGVTEVLQDMIADFTNSTGETWDKDSGVNLDKASEQFGKDFDSGKYTETFVRSAITGAAAVGVQDAAKGTFNKASDSFKNLTGKNIKLGPNDTVIEEDVKSGTPATPEQLKNPNPYVIKDGIPVYLTPQEAITLGYVMPTIESIRGYNIGESAIATELLQQREAEKNGINQVFIDKEKLNEWADTSEKKQAVAELFLGDKGSYLDAQKVPLTREEYYALHKFGNVEVLSDASAITSTGMTLGQLKELVKSKTAKTIPKASEIPASGEINSAGEIDITTEPEVSPTANLGMDSTIEEVKSTLKNKQQADEYLKRLQDEETNLSTQPQESTEPVGRERTSPAASDEEINALAEELYYNDSPEGQMDGGGRFVFGDDSIVSGEVPNSDLPTKLSPGKNSGFKKAEDIYQERLDMYKRFSESTWNTEQATAEWTGKYQNLLNTKDQFIADIEKSQNTLSQRALENSLVALKNPGMIEPDYNIKATQEKVKSLPVKTVTVRGKEYKIHTEIDYNNQLIIVATDGKKSIGDLKLHLESSFDGKNVLAPKFISGQVPGIALELMRYARENIGHVNDSRVKTAHGKAFAAKAEKRAKAQGIAKYKAQAEQMLKSEPTWVSQDQMGFDDVASNQSDRLNQIKEMRERVNAIRDELPDFIAPPEVDLAIADFENFGDVTENVLGQMTQAEQEQYKAQVTKAKTDMKQNLKDSAIVEFEKVASLTERELNEVSQDEIINEIMSDQNVILVDSVLGDKTLKIDPTTLTSNQTDLYINNPDEQNLLIDRKIFKAGGMHIEEVAAQLGVTPDKLLETLAYSPTSKQAYETRTKLEEARNKKIAADNTEINKTAIDKTIEDVVTLKKKMLNNILKANPKAGLRLIHSIFKVGNKTSVENVSINAQEVTENTRIGNLKPSSYLNASRRHMNRANTAINKNQDLAGGAAQVEKSMVADELFKASTKTIRTVNQILNKLSNLSRNKATMDKLRSTGHYDAFQSLMAMLGQRKLTNKDVGVINSLMIEWHDKGLESDTTLPAHVVPALDNALENNKPVDINDLSLNQVETIKAVIDQVLADSNNEIKQRKEQQVLFDKDIAAVVEKEVEENPHKDGSKSQTFAEGGSGWWKKTLSFLSGTYNTSQSNDDMLDWFKLDKSGVIGTVWRQVKGIGLFDNGMGTKGQIELSNKVLNYMYSSVGKETMKRFESYAGQFVYVPEWKDSTGLLTSDGKIKLTNLVGMLAIYGTQDGRNRLSKYGINIETLPQVIEKYLHPDDIQIVEATYKAHDYLKPGIENVEKTLRGINKVEFVSGDPFIWNGKEVEGGYINFSYRTEQSVESQARRDQQTVEKAVVDDKAFNDADAARGFTKEGFKKAREKNVDAFIETDFNLILDRSLNAIVANNTMLVPIYNAMRILNNPKVAKQYINVMGKEGYKTFKANILTSGKNSKFDVHEIDNLFKPITRKLQTAGMNFMLGKIVGSVSSLGNQFLTFPLIVGTQIDKNPKIVLKSTMFWLRMLTNLKSVSTLIDTLSDKIPAIRTDKTNYSGADIKSFRMFNKSESGSGVVRAVVNGGDTLTDIWLSKGMGSLDEFNKSAYALALLDSAFKGEAKGGPTKLQLSEMTEEQIGREVFAFVDEEIAKLFPDNRITSSSYLQSHPLSKPFFIFFNDARRVMNAFYFPRIREAIEAITKFPKNAEKMGIPAAIAKSTKDITFNAFLIHLHAAVIDASLRSMRGEDDEGERDGNQTMIDRWFDIFGKNIKDEYMILKGVADVVPVASSVKFFVETGGRSEGLTTPPITYVKTLIENVRNVINVSFTDKEWEDAESRDLVNALSGITPFPAGQINNYLFGESTAFQTGVASIPAIIGGIQTLPQRLKDMVEIVKEVEGKAQASQLTQVEESTLVEVYRTLMEEPGGRSTLASYIEQNQIPIMSQDEVYNIIFTESNGVPNAVNNRSGAAGIGQFMTNTWNDLIGEHSNELRDIDPAGGESDGRVDPVQSMVMLERLHKDIAISLVRSGIEPSQTNIYIGHHFGIAQAIELIKADDSTKAKVAYGKASRRWASVVDQNPWVRNNMTVGQFKEHIDYLLMVGAEKQLRWEEENGPFDPYNLP